MPIRLLAIAACLVIAGVAWAQSSQLEIKDAWARATAGKAEVGAVYLTVLSPTADRLVAISSEVAKKAQVHRTSMAGMVMQMRPIAALDIPAGQPLTLEPGGTHIMLEGLNQPLREGQSFALRLTFAKAGEREVSVAVEKPGAMGPQR